MRLSLQDMRPAKQYMYQTKRKKAHILITYITQSLIVHSHF